jgi:hypothetical protein
MKRLTFLLFFIFLITSTSYSQKKITWPEITEESKPWARWWWMGSAVNDSDLTYNMELYQKAGLGGLEITPIYGVKGYEKQFIDFLSPKWMGVFMHTLKEGKRLGLGIDLANATGWPFGGPWVMQDDVCKYITYKTYTLNEGQSLKDTLNFIQKQIIRVMGRKVDVSEISDPVAKTPNLQEKALDQVRFKKPIPLFAVIAYNTKGESMDLTTRVDATGKLNWIAPSGTWTIYALFQGWHGKLVERAAPGGEGDVIDHFSEVALKRYLNHFDGAFHGYDLSGLRGYFNDSYEVDDANGQSNWTPLLFDEFYKRRGYDLRTHLPALLGKDSADKNIRVICDYRETVSDMIYEHFTNQWHDWAKKQGKIIRNQAHGSPANILDLYSVVDIPEIEGTNTLRLKFASSASNIMGKKYTSSESATWLNEHFLSSLGDVKHAMDRFLLAGINHTFYHGVNYSPKNDPWPGWLFYAAVHFQPTNPLWNDFAKLNRYIARCQSFLQKGKPDNDVLLYFPIYESWSEPGKEMLRHYDGLEKNFDDSPVKTDAEYLQDKGYAFDYISDRMLQTTKGSGGKIITPGGNYQTLVLSQPKLIPIQTLIKLLELAENGATLIFHKTLPGDVPGLSNLPTRKALLHKLLSGINFEKSGSFQSAAYGKGHILMGDSLNILLSAAKIRRETMVDDNIQCIRRKTEKGDYYFISNWGNKAIDGWIPLAVTGKSAALFNPMLEINGLAKLRTTQNKLQEVYIQLQPDESCVIEISEDQLTGNPFAYYKTKNSPIEIAGKWKVTFVEGGPQLHSPIETDKLISWTELGGDTCKKFSGSANYEITFSKPKEKSEAWILDLGKVHESALVYLNDIVIDTLIGPNFRVILPQSALKPNNKLVVKISNLMANRIADMDRNKIPWKKFYNINFQARLPENRDENGLFTAAKWLPRESGLIGPVILIPIEYIKK